MAYVVAGGTSGTGVAVVQRLARQVGAEHVNCLVRPTSDTRELRALGVRLHTGDVADPASFLTWLDSSVVYLDMTHPRYYQTSIPALTAAGVARAVFVTTTGIFSRYHSCADIYRRGEERIQASGLVWTILRPSMIYGSLRDKNIHRLIRFLDRHAVFPLFNGGRSLMQPVFVDDLADGIVTAVLDTRTEGQAYNLAGPEPLSYREIIDGILRELRRTVRMLPINTELAYALVSVLQWLPGFPINAEQVLRLKEDKVFDITKAARELGYHPRGFTDGIRQEIEAMRTAGALRSRQGTGRGTAAVR